MITKPSAATSEKTESTSPARVKKPLISRVFRVWTVLLVCAAMLITSFTALLARFDLTDHRALVIVLDPGHGGADVGAVNRSLGLYESEINLKIALACRDKLKEYEGVRVYMTHTGVRSDVAKSSLSSRVGVAEAVGADIFISLHINSADNKSAAGAEVYVPITSHEPKYNPECTALAEKMIANFQALGLGSRGVKTRASGGGRVYTFPDGTTEPGDYYYVIGEPISRLGIPGMLVEHAFIDGDAAFLDSDAKLTALGVADATAIAAHYGLKHKEAFAGSDDFSSSQPDVSSVFNPDVSSDVSSEDVSSEPVSSEDVSSYDVSSEPVSSEDVSSEPVSSEEVTSEDEEDPAVLRTEALIRALPDIPTDEDGAKVNAARRAYVALSEKERAAVSESLRLRLYTVVTSYEHKTHPIRFRLREGSQMTIDRVCGQLLHAGTAKQRRNQLTLFSLLMETELFIDPEVPEEYRSEDLFTFRALSPDGTELGYDDEVPEGSVISLYYNDLLLDSLTVVTQ